VDDREPVPRVGPVFLAVIVCTAFDRSGCSIVAALGAGLQRLVDSAWGEAENARPPAGVDGDARVLTDEVLLASAI